MTYYASHPAVFSCSKTKDVENPHPQALPGRCLPLAPLEQARGCSHLCHPKQPLGWLRAGPRAQARLLARWSTPKHLKPTVGPQAVGGFAVCTALHHQLEIPARPIKAVCWFLRVARGEKSSCKGEEGSVPMYLAISTGQPCTKGVQ